jgi:hypothetical protein
MNVAGYAIFRGDTGVGTPRQLIITSGGSTPVYLEAKGYGANYQTDFGIRTYNNVGTAFEVFYADSSGRVGINQVSPAYQLDVNGTGRFTGSVTAGQGYFTHTDTPVKFNNSGGTITQVDFLNNGTQKAAIWWNNSTNTLNLYTGVTALTIASTGAATFSSGVTATTFGATGQISTSNGVDTDMLLNTTASGAANKYGSIQSSVSARALALNPTNGGNVLIGNATDSGYKLDVNGTGRFSGALSGTSASFSGVITSTQGNNGTLLQGTSATTGWVHMIRATNTGQDVTMFIENSTGGDRAIGTLPYAAGLCTYTNTALQFGTNNNIRLTIGGTGAATFSYTVLAAQFQVDNAGIAEIRLRGGGYAGSYNTSLRSISGAIGVLQFGNNDTNYILAGNTAAGGHLIFRVNCASESITSGTEALRLQSNAAALFASSVTAASFFESSDSRLKTLIQDNYQTKGIASITPKLYTKNGKVELGYYAQDFVGILDSAVSKGSDDMLSLSYREVLVAKVYALEQEIKELKAKMN